MASTAPLSPKQRRAVLGQLARDRLAELTQDFELEVTDRRSVDAHIDAIVRQRWLHFRRMFESSHREELQAAGEAFISSSKLTDAVFTKLAVKIRCLPRVTKQGAATPTAVGGY